MIDNSDDIYARGSILIKIVVWFTIIMLIYNNLPGRLLIKIILIVSVLHLIKLIFVFKTWKKKKKEITGLDGPKLYVNISELLGGPSWHKQHLWPRLFVPTIRVWLCIMIILYVVMYGGGSNIKIAMVIAIIYCVCSVYPEYVKIRSLKCDIYGGNFIFTLLIIIFISKEISG